MNTDNRAFIKCKASSPTWKQEPKIAVLSMTDCDFDYSKSAGPRPVSGWYNKRYKPSARQTPVMTQKKTINLETIHQCNCCLGNKTLHPLVSIIDLSKAGLTAHSVTFGFYTVLLIENECTDFKYGRKYYDYSNATLIFLPPGTSLQLDETKPQPPNGWLLAFHPHLICGTTLGTTIDNYPFFFYRTEEALHLSLREKTKAIECLTHIGEELQHAIDRHSQILVSRYIELLLDYSTRFYERQFVTRCEANKEIIDRMNRISEEYIQSGKLKNNGLPSAEYCSSLLHLSPAYFKDLLKFETGHTLTGYFRQKQIEAARILLQHKNNDLRLIAEQLGFPDEEAFIRVFRKITGTTPLDYMCDQN